MNSEHLPPSGCESAERNGIVKAYHPTCNKKILIPPISD